jgi:hypothetical protein
MPKKDILEAEANTAERKKENATPSPETKIQDLGKVILPPENLAAVQKIIEMVSPTTRSNPFEVSIGILTNGKKNIGNKAITTKSDQNEILSKIFDIILYNFY